MAITITQPTRSLTFDDGHGRRTVVRNDSGQHFLVSEVHREPMPGHRFDETLVFPCTQDGAVTDECEVFSGYNTEHVLQNFNG